MFADFSVDAISNFEETELDKISVICDTKTLTSVDVNISNRSFSVVLPYDFKMDFIEFAKRTKNCIIHPARPWRCIYHTYDMTITMSGLRAWMVSTRIMDEDMIVQRIQSVFGFTPREIHTSNMTFSINTNSPIDIFDAYRRRNNVVGDSIVRSYHLDEQQYPALRVHMSQPQHVAMEIYSSGRIVATGFKNMNDLDIMVNFIKMNVI
jgi:hypothetical protein